jgi:hypothetical protein
MMPSPNALTRTIGRRRPGALKPHPELLALLGRPPDGEIDRLAESLAADRSLGLLPEITPGGLVLHGHAAVLAARRAGLRDMEVVVREDLVGRAKAVVALAVIDTALESGGLGHLEVARCLRRAHELRVRTPCESYRPYQLGDLVQHLAGRLGVSRRTALRYLRLMDAPREVQAAFTAGRLPLTVAERAADLPAAARDDLAAALRRGEHPRQVFARYVSRPAGRHKQRDRAWAAVIASLQRCLLELGGRADQIPSISAEDAAVVDQALAVLRQVRDGASVVTREQAEANLRVLLESVGRPRPPRPRDTRVSPVRASLGSQA